MTPAGVHRVEADHIAYYPDMLQGSDEWLDARCGLITASEVKLLLTPATLALAKNDKLRAHLYELAAQRISRYVEPSFISDDMVRGLQDEVYAADHYREKFEVGLHPWLLAGQAGRQSRLA